MLATDVMTRDLITVGPKATVREAMNLIREHRFHDIPVVGPDGKLMGVITAHSILRTALPAYISEDLVGAMRGMPDMPSIYEHLDQIAHMPVIDLMDRHIIIVRPDMPTSAVAAMLVHLKNDTHNVMVADADGKLLGSIACADIFFRMPHNS